MTGKSAIQNLQPWFGMTVQFPLGRALNVKKGYLIALTVPSWAPALALGMGNDTSWRASRARDGCQEPGIQSAQLDLRDLAQYRCIYRTARLTYSATLITTPKLPKPADRGAEALEQRLDHLRVELGPRLGAQLRDRVLGDIASR